ncbi:HD domain-containing phosphohydrolase [Deinococcus hohokamensis]|uniref:HD domain-containing phosphohydrolase n=1 Tax=Deinococcus hohokamensis TaxID=309883 RepID=A0ABV9IC13_9DEIO
MLLNFSLLIASAYLVSLLYRQWPVRRRWWEHGLRVALAAAATVLLQENAVLYGAFRLDLHAVPVALVALRYGLSTGLLSLLPAVAIHLLEDRTGGLVSLLSGLSVVGLATLLRPWVQPALLSWRQVGLVPVPFLGVGLDLLLTPGGRALVWPLYPAELALNALGLLVAAGILGSRLRLLHLTHVLETQALTDPLTGLSNRRAFDDALTTLDPGNQLVLLDIDHFKRVNDTYGHLVGDRALDQVARVLREATPAHVRAYRIGGEEFALLLDLGSEARALALVEAVLGRVPPLGHGALEEPEGSGRLTLSAGLATRLAGEAPSELFRRADEALYLAKMNGRNRVVVAGRAGPDPATAQGPGQSAEALRPRHGLWSSLRTTVDLLSQRRALTDADWQRLLELAVENVEGAEAGSLNIREGRAFRLCAAVGYGPELLNLRLNEPSQLLWYGGSEAQWRSGEPRVSRSNAAVQRVWADADRLHPEGQETSFVRGGRPDDLQANLCVPVVLGGEVVAHLNLDAFATPDAFGDASLETAILFAQQLAALLHLQERWRELDLLAQLHSQRRLPAPDQPDRPAGSPENFAERLTDTAMDLLRASEATLLRYDAEAGRLESVATQGRLAVLGPVSLDTGQGLSWEALRTGEVIRVPNTSLDPRVHRHDLMGESAMLLVPLQTARRQPLGVLVLARTARRPFLPDDEHLALMLAGVAERLLERTAHTSELRAMLEAALSTLGVALETRDLETQGHTGRVVRAAQILGRAAGLGEERLTALRHGSALHDIGKLGVPDAVLLKPGRLTSEERRIVERHTVLGDDLARRIPFLHPEAHEVIRSHHERWDGRGYPDGLAGEAIPELARLFALCDVYDALVSARPYKAAMTPSEALATLLRGRGTHFDPALTDLFAQLWEAGELR